MSKLSKRMKKATSLVEADKLYSLEEALSILKQYGVDAATKFNETVDIAIRLGVDPKHSDQIVRGIVPMPHGLGKKVRVLVFTDSARIKEAEGAGADIVGDEALIEEVKAGRLDFDVCIATPGIMPKVGVLGKVLGPKGLMPNPKLGTVTENIEEGVKTFKAGQVEYKVEKAGLVHAGVGKLNFSLNDLKDNILALYNAVLGAKPSGAKGVYMRKMYISSTMGPAIPIDLKAMLS
ncbi:50S ribosomal protein L1 [Rickettsiales endosymbiont of Peranema trichophorum]|nr:50S ribosomal protein L1 [Rickettsiales endosymbiont of Peranema trichophorum]RZI46719.1 50S ribosomal protein L1 [Rickettsiales endosymbiont of Peranema trichophorum]